jgi:hypothetical protein
LLTTPDLLTAAKKQFEQDTKDSKYVSLLPPGAKPPVDLNKERDDGKVPPGDAKVLPEQKSAV